MRDRNTVEGVVQEALPSLHFLVRIGERTVRCALSGKMFMNRIRILPEDRVDVVISGTMGRIVRRK